MSNDGHKETHIGLTGDQFKTKKENHTVSFRNSTKRNATEPVLKSLHAPAHIPTPHNGVTISSPPAEALQPGSPFNVTVVNVIYVTLNNIFKLSTDNVKRWA